MSLYDLVHGVDDCATLLLRVLGIERHQIPRFRDCFLNGKYIVIHTRTGGGNRLWYENEESHRTEHQIYYPDSEWERLAAYNADLRRNPYYLSDADDDFDCTYANFFFSFPTGYQMELELLAKDHQTPMPGERWKQLFKDTTNDA